MAGGACRLGAAAVTVSWGEVPAPRLERCDVFAASECRVKMRGARALCQGYGMVHVYLFDLGNAQGRLHLHDFTSLLGRASCALWKPCIHFRIPPSDRPRTPQFPVVMENLPVYLILKLRHPLVPEPEGCQPCACFFGGICVYYVASLGADKAALLWYYSTPGH